MAEEILIALKERYLKTGAPGNLTLVYAAGIGDGKERGVNHLAQEGLLKKLICGHIGLAPKLQDLVRNDKILVYNFPQGTINQLFRDIAAHRPGAITAVGLDTFIDPRMDGGKLNAKTKNEGDNLIEVMSIGGSEYLFFKAFPINIAIIRGTTADTSGNISMEKEALTSEVLSLAMAARNSNGFVIAQVERIAEHGTLSPRNVKVPGILVDCVVLSKPGNHWQTFAEAYSPAFSAEIRVPMQFIPAMEMSERKIIARRAAFELRPNSVVNLGIGMPEGIAQVANEEKLIEYLTLTAEPGVIGGMPNGGLNFGTGTNIDALIDQPYQFDFYDGGGLDIAFLGMAQADMEGNVNVSRYGQRFVGPGGFIDISQSSKKVVFVGTFTAGGLKVSMEDGKLKIIQEGKEKKFIARVDQKTFGGRYAAEKKRFVLYVTERCVFALCEKRLELIEVAPGIDYEKDILARMEFEPVIRQKPCSMDLRIFRPETMGLREDLLRLPIRERLTYDPAENIFFVNFENLHIKSQDDIKQRQETVEKILGPLGRKVKTIVNYDNFDIMPELIDEYADMVKYVMQFYESTTRYTTSTFLRMKLGDELLKRNLAPHLWELR